MGNYSYEISKILKDAENEMMDLKHPYVGSEHLVLSILKHDSNICKIVKKYNLSYDTFKKELLSVIGKSSKKSPFVLYTPLLKRIIESAISYAKEEKISLSPIHLFQSVLEEKDGIAIRIMDSLDIDIDKLYLEISKIVRNTVSDNDSILYELGYILNDKVNMNDKTLKRDKELDLIMQVLLRKHKNNPLLLGHAGVGKTAIVEELARLINRREVPDFLLDKKILVLEMGSLISGTKYRGEFEERLNKVIKELLNKQDIILFIDEIHTLVNAGGAEGAIDAANILKPYLARGDIKCIGATTIKEYQKYIEPDKALERRFHNILIKEPSIEETKEIIKGIKNTYEYHHCIRIKDEVIDFLVDTANKYISDHYEPDKSIDILDSACSMVRATKNEHEVSKISKDLTLIIEEKNSFLRNHNYKDALLNAQKEHELMQIIQSMSKEYKKTITKANILETIENKTGIPLLNQKENIKRRIKEEIYNDKKYKDYLLNIENYLLSDNKDIMLIGNNKVIKEDLLNIVNKVMNANLIKIDLNEYSSEISLTKLIGSSKGYVGYEDECIFDELKKYPYSLIYIDNIDSGCMKVNNLIKQIIDNRYLTNSKGEKISFNNAFFIISLTKNSKSVGFTNEYHHNVSKYNIKNIINITNDLVYKSV